MLLRCLFSFFAGIILLLTNCSAHAYEKLLEFPISIKSSDVDVFGAVMHQYQFAGHKPYFHSGLDLLGAPGQTVFTPVTGTLSAGYYSYEDQSSGHSKKIYVPFTEDIDLNNPPLWGNKYFEVAVTTHEGTRFEFHHIDPFALTEQFKEEIFNANTVLAGRSIGKIIHWPESIFGKAYHHIHYNIISHENEFLNPLSVSTPIEDEVRPIIGAMYMVKNSSDTALDSECENKNLGPMAILVKRKKINIESDSSTLIFSAYDRVFAESYFRHPVTELKVFFEEKLIYSFNYRERLDPRIQLLDIYNNRFCVKTNGTIKNYGTNFNNFYYNIPIEPIKKSGELEVEVSDVFGNTNRSIYRVTYSQSY